MSLLDVVKSVWQSGQHEDYARERFAESSLNLRAEFCDEADKTYQNVLWGIEHQEFYYKSMITTDVSISFNKYCLRDIRRYQKTYKQNEQTQELIKRAQKNLKALKELNALHLVYKSAEQELAVLKKSVIELDMSIQKAPSGITASQKALETKLLLLEVVKFENRIPIELKGYFEPNIASLTQRIERIGAKLDSVAKK